jgi:hypothetical protein
MISALERKDADAFEKLVIDHLLFSKESYMAQLKGVSSRPNSRGAKQRPHTTETVHDGLGH